MSKFDDLKDKGLISGSFEQDHKDAIESLTDDEHKELVRLLKKIGEAKPGEEKADPAVAF